MKKKYFLLCLVLFLCEIIIALFFDDPWIRAFVGDMLVVLLIYSFLRIFYNGPINYLAIGILLFACSIEIGQFFNLVTLLGLEDHRIARMIIGATFDWWDIIAYLVGTLFILRIEASYFKRKKE